MIDEDDNVTYVDFEECPHEDVKWTEELITEGAQYIGYKCQGCGHWVNKDDEELEDESDN